MDGRSDGGKYTFLVTLERNGVRHNAIGLIPIYELIGLTAAFLLFGLRMIQGLCLGGEYGGAITYVAEHVPEKVAVTTPAGCRPLRLSGSWCRWP